MSLLEQIQREAEREGVRFVVIGGFAVIAHGYERSTADLDLLVRREDQPQWQALLGGLGYQLINDGGNFLQFAQTRAEEWPLDLMLVRQPTFDGILAQAQETSLLGARVRLVSLEHLIALKLHALKQARLRRFLKDFQDVVELIQVQHLDLQSPPIRDLFLHYGTDDLYQKFRRALGHS
jgi:predicted nucleotidyltransferase